MMRKEAAEEAFRMFLVSKEQAIGEPVSMTGDSPERLSRGWAFYYQSTAYVETGDFRRMLVGHGPVVIRDDGEIIEDGSLDRDPEAFLTR